MSKPNILLIYTGGTIGMVKDFETNTLKAFNFDNLLVRIPEIKQLDCNIFTHSFEEPIDSSNMNPEYWLQISEVIEENYATVDGFVVLHGSDTMSYTGQNQVVEFTRLPLTFLQFANVWEFQSYQHVRV